MRTRIQKLMYLARLVPILVCLMLIQQLSYGQSVCSDPDGPCFLICPGNQKAIVQGVSPQMEVSVDDCEYNFNIPNFYDFDLTGFGITGNCDDFDPASFEVKLVQILFDDTGPGGPTQPLPITGNPNLPFTIPDPNIQPGDDPRDSQEDFIFGAPGQYEILYNLCATPVGGTDPVVISCCTQEVFVRLEHSIACNDQISISMGTNCLAFVTLDMLLEGNVARLGCAEDYYDFQIPPFEVIQPADDSIYGFTQPTIIIDTPGKYVGTITTPTGEICETSVLVEDKVNAVLSCPEITEIRCSQTYAPGDPILDRDCVVNRDSSFISESSDLSNPNTLAVTFDFSDPTLNLDIENTFTVENIELDLCVNVEQVQDVRVYLVSPNNPATTANESDTITILDLVSGNLCTESDFNLELSDDHFLTHNQLITLGCDLGNNDAYCGTYQPLTPFSSFDGAFMNGVWTVLIENNSSVDDLGVCPDDLPKLYITYNKGCVTYPYGEKDDVTQVSEFCYEINFENKNCGPYTACYVDEVTDCLEGSAILGAGGTSTLVERTWTVVSQSSGLTSSCVQEIALTRFTVRDDDPGNPSEIVCAPDYDGTDHAPFLCSQFFTTGSDGTPQLDLTMVTADSLPAPSITGKPEAPFGDIELCPGYQATFTDTKLEICGSFSFKVLREWVILDWCNGDLLEKTQIIKVLDIEAPVVVAPPDGIEVYADANQCRGTWDIDPPITVFDCGFVLDPDAYNFNVGYLLADNDGNAPVDGEYITDENVVDTDGDGFPDEIRDLPFGRTWIRYEVADDCGNVGFAFTEIDIVDHTGPNAVCIEDLVVALDEDGNATVLGWSFDAGSYDNCFIDSVCVRRVDIPGSVFAQTVQFSCEDIGTMDIEVECMVKDASGNTSICLVTIDVQNPTGIELIQTPDDVTIDCQAQLPTGASFEDDFIAEDNLSQIECPITIVCEDPKELTPTDDCGNGSYQVECTISGAGNEVLTEFVNITVENTNPFTEDMVDFTPLQNFTDQILESCPAELNLDPGASELGQPILPASPCGQLAVTYDDQVFDEVENACLKILRTWTVIDWCTYDPNDPSSGGIATYVQVLKINDIELPVFDCTNAGGNIDGGASVGCDVNTSVLDTDGVLVLSQEEGTDACSELSDMPMLVTYEIDFNKDGTIDATGEGRNANGIHMYGCHEITWTIVDFCDNVNSCTYEYCVIDTQAPNLHCVSSAVSVIVDTNTGIVEIWANDFDFGSFDNVTGTCNDNELTFTLTDPHTGQTGSSLSFDCDDIPNGISTVIPLQMWVADEFGNSDFCEVLLILQDNDTDVCEDDPTGSSRVAGNIYTEEDLMVEEAMVRMESPTPWYNQMMTESDGGYFFDEVPNFANYEIQAEKDDSPLNGVSTLDLVLIQKHVLGVEPLSSAYKVIAADADNSGSISAIDLITLRKLILGIDTEFPNDDMPWRFVDRSQQFADALNPFPYNEQIALNNLTQQMDDNDFIAVKIGDVNANAVVNGLHTNIVEKRSSESLNLEIDNRSLKADEVVRLPIKSSNFNNIAGFQFTMWINPSLAEVMTVEEEALQLDDNNFGYMDIDNGHITTSWNHQDGVTLKTEDILFAITIRIKEDCNTADIVEINSTITTAEAYTSDLSTSDVNLIMEGGGSSTTAGYKLYQNTPNPFGSETTIKFEIPADKYISLKIYDINGKLIKNIEGNYKKGLNSIDVNRDDLNENGIFYYQLDIEDFTATKKMIILE